MSPPPELFIFSYPKIALLRRVGPVEGPIFLWLTQDLKAVAVAVVRFWWLQNPKPKAPDCRLTPAPNTDLGFGLRI
jgi:hypothetical protein